MNRTQISGLAVSASLLIGIATNEGYNSDAYKDSVGIPTIGFGETKGVVMGQKTDPVRALIDLQGAINAHVAGMETCVHVPLYQYEFEAYTDLTYNIGVNNFCHSSLVEKLNAKDYDGACKEILRWNRAGGRVLEGLTKRREQEFKHCTGSDNVSNS